MEERESCVCTFPYLLKPFDTVNLKMFFEYLEESSIRGTNLKLFQNAVSNTLSVENGIPKATVLGPLLFLIYINGMFSLPMCKTDIIGFADDTAVFFKSNFWERNFAEIDLSNINN